jgi:hypothetical protein
MKGKTVGLTKGKTVGLTKGLTVGLTKGLCIGLAGKNNERKKELPDLVREARVVALQAVRGLIRNTSEQKKEYNRIYNQARRNFLRAQLHSVMNQ